MFSDIAGMSEPARRPERSDNIDQIAKRLRALRIALDGDAHGSQRAFCTRVGIATNTWNNLEAGRSRISIDTALIVAERTGASLDWIFRGVEYALPGGLANDIRRILGPETGPNARQLA